MFTQFFGNYLLNQRLISPEQLIEGLQEKNNTRMKLGVLAINAGYMTAEQVEQVHVMQTKIDKRIGDIAVDLGYMTNDQVEELLNSQKPGHLLLGQALVDKGYLTNADFEKSINTYKEKYTLTDDDILRGNKLDSMVKSLYDFADTQNNLLYTEYVSLLINNLIRFIGDDFTILEPEKAIAPCDYIFKTEQDIEGEFNVSTLLLCEEKALLGLASRYADEAMTEIDEYATAAACDFMNLNNGLFTVNVSSIHEIELRLTPPETFKGVTGSNFNTVFVLPICYPFGTVKFVISL